jgi:hypothetical protein
MAKYLSHHLIRLFAFVPVKLAKKRFRNPSSILTLNKENYSHGK